MRSMILILSVCLAFASDDPQVENAPENAVTMPNLTLTDQDGNPVSFYDDLIKDRVVAMNFIFTSCGTVCPPMGANFGALRQALDQQGRKDVTLISVSIDPVTDTPLRLKAWRDQFNEAPGWTLLTGEKGRIDKLLRTLEVFSTDINAHAPFVILGDGKNNRWQKVHGLTPPERLVALIQELAPAKQLKESPRSTGKPKMDSKEKGSLASKDQSISAAESYFTNVVLRDQQDRELRFFRDLIKDKTVVINSFFTTCESVCPKTMKTFADIQAHLGERVGKDVLLLSISVDPERDTPERLAAYAKEFKAKPDGWYLLGGKPENVRAALGKIGQLVTDPEAHSNVFIVGNARTGLWKKAFGLADPGEITPIVDSVVNDKAIN